MAASDVPEATVQIGPTIPAEVMATLRKLNLGYDDMGLAIIAMRVLRVYRPLVLDEVQAALRDTEAYVAWARKRRPYVWDVGHLSGPADYLRDTVGAGWGRHRNQTIDRRQQ